MVTMTLYRKTGVISKVLSSSIDTNGYEWKLTAPTHQGTQIKWYSVQKNVRYSFNLWYFIKD